MRRRYQTLLYTDPNAYDEMSQYATLGMTEEEYWQAQLDLKKQELELAKTEKAKVDYTKMLQGLAVAAGLIFFGARLMKFLDKELLKA